MARFHFDMQQGSAEWYRIRSGIPTASAFSNIITPKKRQLAAARHKYACRLVAERLMNWQADSLAKIEHIQAGKEFEPIAVKQLEFAEDIETVPVGFVTTDDGRFGASPDRLIRGASSGFDGVVEVKSPTVPIQWEYLLSPIILKLDPTASVAGGDDYICQVQGQLYVAEADRAIFYASRPMMPPFLLRTHRDEAFIKALADALERFSGQLEIMMEYAKSLGTFERFAEMRTPADVERGGQLRNAPLTSEEELAALIERDWEPDEMHRMGA